MNLPILMYHHIQPRAGAENDLAVSVAAFQAQMEWLRTRGYRSLSLAELAETVRAGRALPKRCVVITFDDAYATVLEHAKPVLDQCKFLATVFAVAEAEGKHNFWDDGKAVPRGACLSRAELAGLAAVGWEIGSHGRTHADLTALPDDALERELADSQRQLARQIGQAVKTFSYPYGAWDSRVRQAVERAGYTAACAISPGTRSVTADLYALRRVYVKPSDSPADFRRKLSPWYLTYRAWRKR